MNDHSSHPTISADGKCMNPPDLLRELAENAKIETLKIIIDGTRILSKKNPTTLLGVDNHFLLESRRFQLTHFEPLNDGRCIVHYVKAP